MISAIILCAGSGTRFNNTTNKVLLDLRGKPVFMHSVDLFSKYVDEVIVVTKESELDFIKRHTNVKTCFGGDTRNLSVLNALKVCKGDYVLIHDGARPYLNESDLVSLINELNTSDACYLGNHVVNTTRMIDDNKSITLDRSKLVEAYTPQGGSKDLFIKALENSIKNNINVTDDINAIEVLGDYNIKMVVGSKSNIKITTSEDLVMKYPRVGHSYDIHQLVENRDLILGGIKLDYHLGLKGHSDADCLLHAISEAMLGALSLGDLGTHFPDTDLKYKGIDSKVILKNVYDLIKSKGYFIGNIDATIYAELPKINPHILKIRESIASILDISIDNISIKATTFEKLDSIGKGLAIASECICMLIPA